MNNKSLSKSSYAKKSVIAILVMVVLVVAIWLVATNGCSDPTANTVDAGSSQAKSVEKIDNLDSDLQFKLTKENTDIMWTGSNVVGQTPTGFFYELDGNVIIDGESLKPKSIEITIDMNGVKAMNSSLTEKLKYKGFFEVKKFPTAKFISTSFSFEPRPDDPDGTNCVVEGNFQLRDTTRSINIPVSFMATKDSFSLVSEFKINRKDYGVIYSDSLGDKAIRDSVMINMDIDVKQNTEDEASKLTSQEPVEATQSFPTENFTETIPETLVEFDMILVPGDSQKGIKPFFIGKTEVTWEEFDYWALCKGMSTKDSIEEISQQLRPSAPHDLEKIYRGWGREQQPVVGISHLSAELYCKWLSKQTGKKYRLPTEDEWNLAYERGGAKLADTFESEQLLKMTWFAENAVSTDDEGFDLEQAMKVGKLEPNQLGVYDMLGNAAEWVKDSDGNHSVRGGHFKLRAEELSGSQREVEDQDVWNKDYPQDPKSKWWYVNADYVGFRVVCVEE